LAIDEPPDRGTAESSMASAGKFCDDMIPNIAASVCSDSSGTDLALHTWSALDWCHSAQVGAAFGNSKFALVGKIRDIVSFALRTRNNLTYVHSQHLALELPAGAGP
jgi:hypothetical protein